MLMRLCSHDLLLSLARFASVPPLLLQYTPPGTSTRKLKFSFQLILTDLKTNPDKLIFC